MNEENKFLELIKSKEVVESIPVNYKFVTSMKDAKKSMISVVLKTGKSTFHNTNHYELYGHYKPISKIINLPNEY